MHQQSESQTRDPQSATRSPIDGFLLRSRVWRRARASPEVKRAYRRLSRRYHPGINPGDRAAEALFQRITEAYETLLDAERRRQYDDAGVPAHGRRADRSSSAASISRSRRTARRRRRSASCSPRRCIRCRRPTAASRRPARIFMRRSRSSFEESMRGAERQVMVTRQVPCGACGGAGHVRTPESRCTQCHGSGRCAGRAGTWCSRRAAPRAAARAASGIGGARVCAGQGRVGAQRTRSPSGCRPAWSTARGCGCRSAATPARAAARPGDLYVDVQVRPHPVLRREGDDLHMIVPVAVHEAALGARIEVPSFDGPGAAAGAARHAGRPALPGQRTRRGRRVGRSRRPARRGAGRAAADRSTSVRRS